MKKFLALLLAAAMTLVLTGCAQKVDQPEQGASVTTEETTELANASETSGNLWTIDVLTDTILGESSIDTTVGKKLAEDFGIAFNFSTYSGDLLEKQALMLAGGDYNEIQYMQGQTMVQKYIDAGALLNLDDYKDFLPDFYEKFADVIPIWRTAAKDGGLYKWEVSTPRELTCEYPHYDIMVRTDVLEYYGYPELVSASDWIEFLEKAVQDFPTATDGQATVGLTVPLAESWGMSGMPGIGFEKGSTYLYCGDDYFVFNVKTNQFEDYMMCPEVKESYQFFNTLYNKGLLDEESFTDLGDQTCEKMNTGKAIAVWYVSWYNQTANNSLTAAGYPDTQYIEMPFQLDSQVGDARNCPVINSYPYMSYGITKNCSDPERFCKFLNWCCTDEGQLLLQSGVKSVHYTIENGIRVPAELRMQCSKDIEIAKQEGLGDATFFYRCLPLFWVDADDGQPYNLYNDQKYKDSLSLSDGQKKAVEGLGWKSSNAWWDENLNGIKVGYTRSCALDPATDLGKIGAKMIEARSKYSANLILTDNFDAEWSALVDEYSKLDYQSVIDEMNRLYESYTK